MSGVSEQLMFQRSLVPLLKRSLDANTLRQKAIAHNLANAETDGYTRRDVRFEEALKEALDTSRSDLARGSGEHLEAKDPLEKVFPELYEDDDDAYFNGHNNVDVDREMTELARAGLGYRFGVRQLRHQFEQIGLAIRGNR
jgi:flagellar basal-body rod protein FlgB